MLVITHAFGANSCRAGVLLIKAFDMYVCPLLSSSGDFGISREFETSMSMADTFVGTPSTISPEIFLRQQYSYKADIWCVMWWPPFRCFDVESLSTCWWELFMTIHFQHQLNFEIFFSLPVSFTLNVFLHFIHVYLHDKIRFANTQTRSSKFETV